MSKQFKFVCVEAVADGDHAKWLVSEHGHFIGVAPRKEQPERVKLEHWSKDQPPTASLCERFKPHRQIRRYTRDIAKAIRKGMLVQYKPTNHRENQPLWVLAPSFAEATKAFGNEVVGADKSGLPTGEELVKVTQFEDSLLPGFNWQEYAFADLHSEGRESTAPSPLYAGLLITMASAWRRSLF